LRFQLHGTEGSYIKYGLDPQEGQLASGTLPDEPGYGIEQVEFNGMLYRENGRQIISTEAGCYQRYFDGLADAIRRGAEPPVRAADAAAVIRILELAETSNECNKTIGLTGF
jgi:scyllo-inositol 2-dehydrogenase (NADP+)